MTLLASEYIIEDILKYRKQDSYTHTRQRKKAAKEGSDTNGSDAISRPIANRQSPVAPFHFKYVHGAQLCVVLYFDQTPHGTFRDFVTFVMESSVAASLLVIGLRMAYTYKSVLGASLCFFPTLLKD